MMFSPMRRSEKNVIILDKEHSVRIILNYTGSTYPDKFYKQKERKWNCLLYTSHFLTGGPLNALIEPQLTNAPLNHIKCWKLVQAFTQHLWKRWQMEYLHTLQERSKWIRPQENLKIGDLVVIHETNLPPLKWKLGRVISVSPGNDGVVRVVNMKTAGGTLTRPSVKVSRLPIY